MTKASRNDPCPCGSGKKFKKCCLKPEETHDNFPMTTEPGGSGPSLNVPNKQYTEAKLDQDTFNAFSMTTENNTNESSSHLQGRKVGIVNIRGNKFDRVYEEFFSRENQVKVVNAHPPQDVAPAIDTVMAWADVILSCWADETLMYLAPAANNPLGSPHKRTSRQKNEKPRIFSFVRSWEILNSQFMRSIDWFCLSGLIFVADHIRELFNEMWGGMAVDVKQTTIYNSVRIKDIPVKVHQPGPNMAYIGYLGPKKGITLLLQCIMAAREVNPNFKLHIAGKFEDKRFEIYVKHFLSDTGLDRHVVFHGWVKDVFPFLHDMDYLISTSPWEGCPNNVIEAMACGVRPLIHNWRGARTIFPHDLVFDSISQMKSMLCDNRYDSQAYRQYAERNFNSEIQLLKISNFLKNNSPEFN